MKRNKKTIAIVAVTLVLAIVATVGTVMYLNDDGTAQAGFEGNNPSISQNGDNAQTNGNSVSENNEGTENNGSSEGQAGTLPEAGNNGEEGTISGNTTTTSTANSGATTTTTTGNADVPNQEYVTERIEEVERQITEDLLVGWTPISINTTYSTAGLGIYKPELSKTKVVATENGNSYVIAGEILTYGIAVKNIGNDDITGVNISDIVPEQTALVGGSTYLYQDDEYSYGVGNYNEELNKISWKVDIASR